MREDRGAHSFGRYPKELASTWVFSREKLSVILSRSYPMVNYYELCIVW